MLLDVSGLQIRHELKCNSICTDMLTFDLFFIKWMQPGPVEGAGLHPPVFDYGMCLFDCPFGRQHLLYWLTAWQSPTHLSCPNAILLPDMVHQMITGSGPVCFPFTSTISVISLWIYYKLLRLCLRPCFMWAYIVNITTRCKWSDAIWMKTNGSSHTHNLNVNSRCRWNRSSVSVVNVVAVSTAPAPPLSPVLWLPLVVESGTARLLHRWRHGRTQRWRLPVRAPWCWRLWRKSWSSFVLLSPMFGPHGELQEARAG